MVILWKFNALDKIQLDLLDQGIIILRGDFDDPMYFYLSEALTRLIARGAPPVTVIITSDGGDIDIGLQIYDKISSYPGETIGIVDGWAKSAAALVLQACKKRQALPFAYLKLHQIESKPLKLSVLQNEQELKAVINRLSWAQNRIIDIFSVRSGKEKSFILDLVLKEDDLDAQTAHSNGLLDEIVAKLPTPNNPCPR